VVAPDEEGVRAYARVLGGSVPGKVVLVPNGWSCPNR
jgi:hypothetical protein